MTCGENVAELEACYSSKCQNDPVLCLAFVRWLPPVFGTGLKVIVEISKSVKTAQEIYFDARFTTLIMSQI